MAADYTRRHTCLFLINHQKIRVIPAKAGIQMINNFPTQVGQQHGFFRFAASSL